MGQEKLLAFWKNPLAVGVVIFGSDFGVLTILRGWEKDQLYLPWDDKTFTFGDGIFLPLYGCLISLVIRQNQAIKSALYSKWKWHVLILSLGVLLTVGLELVTLIGGNDGVLSYERTPKLYHRVIFIPVFYLVVSIIPLVLISKRPSWALGLAAASLFFYLTVATIEMSPLAQDTVSEVANLSKGLRI